MPRALAFAPLLLLLAIPSAAEPRTAVARLRGFDRQIQAMVDEWNCPGLAVGIVVDGKLVHAEGFGYRDYGKKLPFTPRTVMPIASNTKLFTAVTAGLLVEEGKLAWDEPIARRVPAIRFHDDDLQRTVTLRDMLSHRTGITRHDTIWYQTVSPRKDLFDLLRYLEPTEPIRTKFLYNNMMYMGVGYALELVSGRTWEQLVQERIFQPLAMTTSDFSIDAMDTRPDHGVPWTERRESSVLYEVPHYNVEEAIGPAGTITSNVEDLAKWVGALMDGGRSGDVQVIPPDVIAATLQPSIALPNDELESFGWREMLNAAYGMGRYTASCRGHLLAYHGGNINGFHSKISLMPQDRIGVIVLVIGDHCTSLGDVVTYAAYERLLGMSPTPWNERLLEIRNKATAAARQARAMEAGERVAGTTPSHALDDYLGEFEHPAHGVLSIARRGDALGFDFHRIRLPLDHFHYDRFDTPDDEEHGKWSVRFLTNARGDVDRAVMSLDEAEVTFTRRVAAGIRR